jgi:hypothetical protein
MRLLPRALFAIPVALLATASVAGAQVPTPSTAAMAAEVPEGLERVAFAPSLGVDLSRSERLASGIYRRDLRVGAGDTVRVAATLTLHVTVRRADGRVINAPAGATVVQWRPGTFLPGVEQGLRGMRAGGRRQVVIPGGVGPSGDALRDSQIAQPLVVDLELVAVN